MSFSSQTQMTESYKWSATLTSRHPWQRWLVRFSYRPYRKWTEIPQPLFLKSLFESLKMSIFARNGCDEEGWVLMSRQPQVIRVGFTTTDNPPFWNTAWPKNKRLGKKKHLYDQKWVIKPINSTAKCLLSLKRYFRMELKLKSLISRDTCHHMAGRGHWKWTKLQPRESLRWSHNTG